MKKLYTEIQDELQIAYLEAYVNIDKFSEFMDFYFKQDQNVSDKAFQHLLKQISSSNVSILEYIEVSEEHRGQKIGNKLLSQLVDESIGDIILICDITDDFVYEWYERYGFKSISYKSSEQFHVLPIMIFNK